MRLIAVPIRLCVRLTDGTEQMRVEGCPLVEAREAARASVKVKPRAANLLHPGKDAGSL